MTYTSYPAVGINGLSETQWGFLYGSEEGIYEDYHTGGVAACALTKSGDNVTIAPGKVKVNGFMLDISAAETLNLPAVSSATVYYIGVLYDPALNVADGSGNANPLGPCRLIVSAGAPALTGGKAFILLYTVTRAAGGTLAAAIVADARQWRGPSALMRSLPAEGTVGFGPFARGSNITVAGGDTNQNERYVRDVNAAGTVLYWRSLTTDPARAFPAESPLVSNSDAPSAPQYFRYSGNMVKLRGTLKRSTGNLTSGADVTLGTLPAGFRPLFTERFICKVGPNKQYAEVRVNELGVVILTGTDNNTYGWVDLSPIHFRAEQ